MSKTCSVALCLPVALGVNATPSVHDDLGATVTGIGPHVPVPLRAYSESDDVAAEMTSELVLPVLSTVRCLAAVWPMATLPNVSEAVTVMEVVGVAVGVAVAVAVAVAVRVEVAVKVGVAVAVCVAVAVAVAVCVAVAVAVDVAVAVGVGVADGDPNAITRLYALTVPIPVAKSQPTPAAYAAWSAELEVDRPPYLPDGV